MKFFTALLFFLGVSTTVSAVVVPTRKEPPIPKFEGGVWLSRIPYASSAREAGIDFDRRAHAVLTVLSHLGLPKFELNDGVGFQNAALPRLALGVDTASVNRVLLDPDAQVFSHVGSDFHDLGIFCKRDGDYDFMLRGLVELTYRFHDQQNLIWPDTRYKLLSTLLSEKGNKVHLKNFLYACGTWPETENHILQTETSRYLTNQLLAREFKRTGKYEAYYDNEANGMNRWMLFHLKQFFQRDFSEYNSRPYEAYTVMAIQNLYEFAEDPRVKLAAEMLLNYVDAKFAVSSNNLRRNVPFRRQKAYRDRTDMLQIDAGTSRMAILAGNNRIFEELPVPGFVDFGLDRMLHVALGKYRTPELLLDLIIDKGHNSYFQRFKHTGIEMYASSKSFLISAGGIWIDKFDVFTRQDSGWALPTTLMPSAHGIDSAQFIRINGHSNYEKRINTCVAPGFACGLNPVIPDSIPASCRDRVGNWTFVDFTSSQCPLKYGFYVVVYNAPCDSSACKDGGASFGFFEAAEPSPALDFNTFRGRILDANQSTVFRSEQINTYVNSSGQRIGFLPLPKNKYEWGLRSVDSQKFDTDAHRWSLATGDVMTADGSGLVTIQNRSLGQRLVLDMRDPLNPRRDLFHFLK